MQRMIAVYWLKFRCLSSIILVCNIALLSACGGGGNNSSFSNSTSVAILSSSLSSNASDSSSSSSIFSSTSSKILGSSSFSASSIVDTVGLGGTITYDFVPHNVNHIGLNYTATEQRAVRGAVVELIDSVGLVVAVTVSTAEGNFSFSVQKNMNLKVRVKAQLLSSVSPKWNFKVTDNTSNNALYVLDGAFASTGSNNSTRVLHARSGWDGSSYAATRSAAPFAILDNIYIGLNRILAVGNRQDLNPLELRWSTKNSTADGDYTWGEIGTSFYDGSAIYVLGDANNDTDEYDPHVLLHEWGHYLEDELFRSDSIGGDHSDGEFLDIRVAMSEGFANAFSGMMLDDISYADTSDTDQSSGFTFNIGRKNRPNKGYFSEGSVGAIFYNFYTSSSNKTANDFTPLFKVLSNASYYENEALTSIYLFKAQLKNLHPEHSSLFEMLTQEQIIFGADEYGVGESNNGGLAIQLPIYKKVDSNNVPVNVCSDAEYGEQNKLGNSQLIKLTVNQAGSYNIIINKLGGDDVVSNPGFTLYQKGIHITYSINSAENDFISASVSLAIGNYVLEVYDLNNQDNENADAKNITCFDVRAAATK